MDNKSDVNKPWVNQVEINAGCIDQQLKLIHFYHDIVFIEIIFNFQSACTVKESSLKSSKLVVPLSIKLIWKQIIGWQMQITPFSQSSANKMIVEMFQIILHIIENFG